MKNIRLTECIITSLMPCIAICLNYNMVVFQHQIRASVQQVPDRGIKTFTLDYASSDIFDEVVLAFTGLKKPYFDLFFLLGMFVLLS